jgi:2-polyprenyl-3-methyl-5-hydroxy-6-metoxy-1,4-benzoquinol methylase
MVDNESNSPYSKSEIIEEYNSAASSDREHAKVKWGSQDSMMNRFRLASRQVDFSTAGSWLDVGCGTGAFQRLVHSQVSFPPDTIAIDISDELIQYARTESTMDNCEFRCIDFQNVDENNFDIVTAIGVLQKSNLTVSSFFKLANDVLKEGGVFFIDTKNLGWKKFQEPDFDPEPSHRWFETEDLTDYAQKANFQIERVSGFLPRDNRIVAPKESHTIFLLARKQS